MKVVLQGLWKGENPNPEWLEERPQWVLFELGQEPFYPKTWWYHQVDWKNGLVSFGNSHVYVSVAKAEKVALALAKAWFRKNYC